MVLAFSTSLLATGGIAAARLVTLATAHVRTRRWIRYLQSSVPEDATVSLRRR
jgi:hypothetical protein